ncbi:MAG: SDR family oxidoreductase [Spirochaetales bacterium]|nr:SDR family oxidoreductase [Spirochaetales bacterium]
MEMDFHGRTVVVTGGSRGIGAAVSLAFAEAGAQVVINHLAIPADIEGFKDLSAKINAVGGSCISVPGDITDSVFCNRLCETAVHTYGSLDILVNSAGFLKPVKPQDITDELWKQGVEVNLSAAFYLTRGALKYMTESGYGRIIFIGSAGAITGGGGSAFYSAAKAGINGLVRNLSKELAPSGITVNAVLPAIIETDMLRERAPDDEERKKYSQRIPVGRLGQPEDVAWATLFLASEHSGYICGQHIIVDGGSTYK